VRTEPLSIPGLASPVVVESSFLTSRYTITAAGQPAMRIGRKTYAVPASGPGTVETTISGGFFDAYPTLEVNGVKHRTGPQVPMILRILAPVPILLLTVGGALGGLIGALGWMLNIAVLRTALASAVKALLMLVILAAAAVAWYVVASAILGGVTS
jgi:hypothetical protein